MSIGTTTRHEYELRPDLPPGFPPIDKTFATLDEVIAYREQYVDAEQYKSMPQEWRDAFNALATAPIVHRTITEGPWIQVEEK